MKNIFKFKTSLFFGSSFVLLLLFLGYSLSSQATTTSLITATNSNPPVDELLVKYKSSHDPQVIKVDSKNLSQLTHKYQADPEVEYVEPNYHYQAAIIPSDPYYNNQWYLQKINAPKAWGVQHDSPNIVIAVIDSGVQINHPDLKNNIWRNPKELVANGKDDDNNGFIDDINGWDFVNNTADPNPKFQPGFTSDVMHGTIVAGIVAAEGNNATGISGITWKAQIMPLKVLNDKGEGTAANVIRAIDYAINNKANIINLSFVGFGYSQGMDEAIRRAFNAGIIVVAAAGNESTSKTDDFLNDKPMYPVCLDGRPGENRVIGVAATDAMDQKTYFSGYGSRCVDITAPGISIYSTVAYSPTNQLNGEALNKYYDGYWSGTSVATPIISGSLALIEATNPGLNRSQVISALLNNADNINRLNPKYVDQLGHGRVNLNASLTDVKNKLKQVGSSIIIAPMNDHKALVKIINQQDKGVITFNAYDNFNGGVNIATGDVDGDGQPEIITSPVKNYKPLVKIYSQAGILKNQFLAYTQNFLGGVNLAVGDVDGDGRAEIITGAGPGGGPHVKILNQKGQIKSQFFAYTPNFRGGVNLAVGDVDGDGRAEIITGAGPGGGPQIKIFNYKNKEIGNFFAYEKTFKGGVKIAVGDIDGGTVNKSLEIITAPGIGRAPQIKIFDNHAILKANFLAYSKSFKGGVNISSADLNNNGLAEIISGAGPGGGPHVRIFDSLGNLLDAFYAYEDDFKGGVNISIIQY